LTRIINAAEDIEITPGSTS